MLAQPPYALGTTPFRFRALATLAGRLPLGGERELAMAAFVSFRLAADAMNGALLTESMRQARAAGARHWLGAIALPATARGAFAQLIEATIKPQRDTLVPSMERVTALLAQILDPPAYVELRQFVATVRAS